jgi:hypothetical protein
MVSLLAVFLVCVSLSDSRKMSCILPGNSNALAILYSQPTFQRFNRCTAKEYKVRHVSHDACCPEAVLPTQACCTSTYTFTVQVKNNKTPDFRYILTFRRPDSAYITAKYKTEKGGGKDIKLQAVPRQRHSSEQGSGVEVEQGSGVEERRT